MDTWIIYTLNSYSSPRIQTHEVKSVSIDSAISMSGIPVNEIVCVKLKAITETVEGL